MAEILEGPRPGVSSSAALLVELAAPPASSLSVMVIEDDLRMLRYIRTILEHGQREVITCESAEDALECMRDGMRPDVVLISGSLVGMPSLELLPRIRKEHPRANLVLMCHISEHAMVVPAVCQGVCDILLKPFVPEDLKELLGRLTPAQASESESPGTKIPIGPNAFFVFSSPAMRELQEHAALVARVNLPVLILGESGTGKEVLARYIHSLSPQAKRTFLKVNCAAVPSELLESELFGYEPGAFTGAARSKPGKFRQCNNGTMFLDEIGEMHPSLQAKLLQVLQDGSFSPLGSRVTEKVNVRILAATNIDMKAAIAQKRFREDLYYRLNGFSLRLPPLRERRDEIPVLLDYFLRRCSHELGISAVPPVMSSWLRNACLQYDWPGNLRELETFVKRYLVLGDEQLMMEDLRQDVCAPEPEAVIIGPEAISEALSACGGNRRNAARAMGVSYKVLLNRLRKLGMDSARSPLAMA
jgi:two-component system, NtrC family, response regulator AtoC